MSDPFRNYDAWLEAPYQRAAAAADREHEAWERRGIDPSDIQPPHKIGDACPKCGEPSALAETDDEQGILYCANCDRDIDPDEEPTFEPDVPCANPGRRGCGSCCGCEAWAESMIDARDDF